VALLPCSPWWWQQPRPHARSRVCKQRACRVGDSQMARLGRKLRSLAGGRVAFWCPGCNEAHQVRIANETTGSGPLWSWNQCTDVPTFEPSILVRGTERLTDAQHAALMEGSAKHFEPKNTTCHSFVRHGQIEFLGDCTHRLAGKTVPIPDFPSSEAAPASAGLAPTAA
jgi:Family of unknown function (DUF6527)